MDDGMDLGFETIGNATIIVHDGGPLLTTDPWIIGPAYFGSWITTHEIPEEQMAHIRACNYLWISHGHPDHLSHDSLATLKDKQILLPDHYGGRIHDELKEEGFDVRKLETGKWTRLSDRVRVLCVPDYMQDAALLIEMDGNLIVDANDAGNRGGADLVRELVPKYERTFLACLTGYGDADMINYFDEQGNRILPHAAKREPQGPGIGAMLDLFGIDYFCPSSSMHRYQRTDSAWANEYVTPLDAHAEGFYSARGSKLLPAFIRYDLIRGECTEINPPERAATLYPPEDFGDSWSDELTAADVKMIQAYFDRVTHLKSFLGFVNFKVGGKDNFIDVNRSKFDLGVTFETPRASLMTTIEWRFFDDILIGNFARTTLHGDWGCQGAEALYPNFNPFVCKFGDNGGAYTPEELRAYFAEYRRRGFFEFGQTPVELRARGVFAPYLA